MTGKWTAKSYSSSGTAVTIDETSKNDELVILLQGKNSFSDDIYSYLKLTMEKMYDLRIAMLEGKNFMPSDFGTVLAAGRGEPPQELRSEMAVRYKMIDKPRGKPDADKPTKPKLGSFAPKPPSSSGGGEG